MAKREIPLFCYDTERKHKLGECDFVTCTDIDNAFIGKIDYVEGGKDYTDADTYIKEAHNGLAVRLTIKRRFGLNPSETATRTLMRKAVEQYMNRVIKFDIADITDEQLHQFCDIMIKNGFQNLGEAGVNQSERNTILSSIAMMTKLKEKI